MPLGNVLGLPRMSVLRQGRTQEPAVPQPQAGLQLTSCPDLGSQTQKKQELAAAQTPISSWGLPMVSTGEQGTPSPLLCTPASSGIVLTHCAGFMPGRGD